MKQVHGHSPESGHLPRVVYYDGKKCPYTNSYHMLTSETVHVSKKYGMTS